jgi:hypothetical protein
MLHRKGCSVANDRPPVNAFHDEYVLSPGSLMKVCGWNYDLSSKAFPNQMLGR